MTSIRILIRACQQWSENRDSRMGAALAYYALFSFAPLLVLAVMIAGMAFGEEAAKGQIEEHLREVVPAETAVTVQRIVDYVAKPQGTLAPSLNIIILMFGALGMFLHMRNTFSNIWRLEPPRGNTFLGILWDYSLALIMVFFCGVLLFASLAAGMFVTIFRSKLDEWIPGIPWRWIELGLSFLYLTVLFAALYRILSGGRITWGYVVYGSFIAAVMFTVGKTLLGYYFIYSTTASAYGAASSLVAFLMWVYYSSQILFFGAELIQARRTRADWMNQKQNN